MAVVALANGLNANFLRSRVKVYRDHQRSDIAIGVERTPDSVPAKRSAATLVPVRVQAPSDGPVGTIEVEIRRQQTVVAIQAEQLWLAVEPVDMRLGIDGLSLKVQQALGVRRVTAALTRCAPSMGAILKVEVLP